MKNPFKAVAEWIGKLFERVRLFAVESGPEDECRRIIVDAVRQCFVESRSPDGIGWMPLKYRSGKALILTGLLMREALAAAERTSFTKAGGTVMIRSVLDRPHYAMFHQFGAPRARIPIREFFGLGMTDVERVVETYGEFAKEYMVNFEVGW